MSVNGKTEATWWHRIFEVVKSQVWALPALVVLVFAGLSVAMLRWGPAVGTGASSPWWLYSGDAKTARDLLGAILSGLITMTSLVLSMTFVVLTLAANQLGPRLVTILTGDRQIQLVLGLFVGTIVYVLVVLRSLDDDLGSSGVPHSAITLASVLIIICLLALLFYVHKIARLLVSDVVVERVAKDLHASLRESLVSASEVEPGDLVDVETRGEWLSIGRAGYVKTIDYAALVDEARTIDAVLHIAVRPGDFVLRNGLHVAVSGPTSLSTGSIECIRKAFEIGPERSHAQDLEYAVRQLVESATRALSSGINDPFTVVAVIDKLGAAIEDVTGEDRLPTRIHRDEDGRMRLVVRSWKLAGLVDASFDQIRQDGGDQPVVAIHLADTLGRLLIGTRCPQAEAVLRSHLYRLEQTVRASIDVEVDLTACIGRIEAAQRAVPQVPRWPAPPRRLPKE
jgi:uncharacterized membrane protein